MRNEHRCNCCGHPLSASDEGFDGVCASCAVAADVQPRRGRVRRRQGVMEMIGERFASREDIEWVMELVGV